MQNLPTLPRHIVPGQVFDLRFSHVRERIVLLANESKPDSVTGVDLLIGTGIKLRVRDGIVYNPGNWWATSIELFTPAEAEGFIKLRPRQFDDEARELRERADRLSTRARSYREASDSFLAALPKEVV